MRTNIFSILIVGLISFASCKNQVKEPKVPNGLTLSEIANYDEIARETTRTNWLRPPYKHWAIKNVDKLFDVSIIAKGDKVSELPTELKSFSDLKIEQFDGKIYGFDEHLDSNRTDGFLVLHKGKIVVEKYYKNMMENSTHNWFSMSKSLTGLTLAILADEGKIDLQKPTLHYLPELEGSAWDGTTVQMVMDMLVGIQYNEAYNDPSSDAYKFAKISNFVEIPGPPSKFRSISEYLKTVKKGRNHDELFHYVSLNTEILGMLITKVTGLKPTEVMSEKIWKPMGAEQNGFIMRDPNGQELVSAAVNSNLRDAGRLGLMLMNDGYLNGQQIVSKKVVDVIKKGGSIEKFADSKRGRGFKNFSYKNQFWHTDNTAFFAKGLFGQWIYVDPAPELVIVKMTTSDIPTSTEYDWINNMNLMNAIVERVETEK